MFTIWLSQNVYYHVSVSKQKKNCNLLARNNQLQANQNLKANIIEKSSNEW